MIWDTPISWSSRKKIIEILSSCEAEYIDASYSACQAAWMEMLLKEFKIMEPKKTKLFVDNNSAIDLTNHLVCYDRSKHIEWMYHFLRDQVNKGNLELEHCKSERQLTDILTKSPKKFRFNELKKNIGIRNLETWCVRRCKLCLMESNTTCMSKYVSKYSTMRLVKCVLVTYIYKWWYKSKYCNFHFNKIPSWQYSFSHLFSLFLLYLSWKS